MKTAKVLKFFGGSRAAVARALGIKAPSVYTWGERVPELRAMQLERITEKKLKYNPRDYKSV